MFCYHSSVDYNSILTTKVENLLKFHHLHLTEHDETTIGAGQQIAIHPITSSSSISKISVE